MGVDETTGGAGGGGPAEGDPVEPRDAGGKVGEECGEVQEVPLGLPASGEEYRRLKEDARRARREEQGEAIGEDENEED